MTATTGIIYVTIAEKQIGASGNEQFRVVRASPRRHQPGPGEVELPIRITLDRAWFTKRAPVVSVTVPDRGRVDAALGSE